MAVTTFEWKEENSVLLTPRADPFIYEMAADQQFDTKQAAYEWRAEEVENAEGDDAEVRYIESWQLVKVTYEAVS